MYNINQKDIEETVATFSSMFEYDYYLCSYVDTEGISLVIGFYNSPIRASFGISVSYDENTYIDTITDAIINAYINRRVTVCIN